MINHECDGTDVMRLKQTGIGIDGANEMWVKSFTEPCKDRV
jgi:hypothetical protein